MACAFPEGGEDIEMPLRVNPFQQVYLTELIPAQEYTQLFSPFLINDTLSLFQAGNIIIEGIQGSGKSMLLELLKPQIRMAYYSAQVPFPVPEDLAKFIGAGINVIRSGAADIGQRMTSTGSTIPEERLVRHFADFMNYWIVDDLLNAILALSENQHISKLLGINYSAKCLDEFALNLKSRTCWFDYLQNVADFGSLRLAISGRIKLNRKFNEGHISDFPAGVIDSTTSPGDPISQTVIALRESNVIPPSIPVFIRVDQCEDMVRLEAKAREHKLHCQFREVTNKMLGTRDPNISYRFGGRKYAFRQPSEQRMHGTTAPIEDMRNFKIIDLDEILRRRENTKSWIFPQFAEDVLWKRLQWAKYDCRDRPKDLIAHILDGTQLTIAEKVSKYVRGQGENIIEIDDQWSPEVKRCLLELLPNDPLSAKLGEAWVRQQMERKVPDLPSVDRRPWELAGKRWWKKERLFLAFLQIAARNQQKMIWARKKDVIDLSGGNISAFLSLLQHIWTAWMRTLPRDTDWTDDVIPQIEDEYVQSEGIEEASDRWYETVKTEAKGDSRRRFVAFLGLLFRNTLRSDKRMSYPGNNGISITINDLESDPQVYEILKDASAYGVMVDMKHTPKTITRGESWKWYLHPIFAPHFQIPAIHTKEPMYVDTKRLRKWLIKARIISEKAENRVSSSGFGGAES
jgi:hypothetical protein